MLNNRVFCKVESKINSFTNANVATSKINDVKIVSFEKIEKLFEENVEKLLFNENVEKLAFETTVEMLFAANVDIIM